VSKSHRAVEGIAGETADASFRCDQIERVADRIGCAKLGQSADMDRYVCISPMVIREMCAAYLSQSVFIPLPPIMVVPVGEPI
jgi:hypothetical protein